MFQTFFEEAGENRVFYIAQHKGYPSAKRLNNWLPHPGKEKFFCSWSSLVNFIWISKYFGDDWKHVFQWINDSHWKIPAELQLQKNGTHLSTWHTFFWFTKLISFGSIALLVCKNTVCLWEGNGSITSGQGIGVYLHHQETVLCTRSSFIWFQACTEFATNETTWDVKCNEEKTSEAVVQHQPITREPSIY